MFPLFDFKNHCPEPVPTMLRFKFLMDNFFNISLGKIMQKAFTCCRFGTKAWKFPKAVLNRVCTQEKVQISSMPQINAHWFTSPCSFLGKYRNYHSAESYSKIRPFGLMKLCNSSRNVKPAIWCNLCDMKKREIQSEQWPISFFFQKASRKAF